LVVGVLGGIGAGKSTVTRMLAELGAEAVFADDLAHEFLERPAGRAALVSWMGPEVLDAGGKVNRAAVARRVFSDARELRRLEELVHPEVKRRIEEKVAAHRQAGGDGVLALDVPLLLESALDPLCDALIFVEASPEARAARVAERGWPREELERRERLQASLSAKRQVAGHVIDNSGAVEQTRGQVAALYRKLKSGEGRAPAVQESSPSRRPESPTSRRTRTH
jgi:dephospho-CoA kinase